ERFARLGVVIDRSGLARHADRVGRTEEVLVEGPSKRDASVTTGRTRQNKLVHFSAGDTALSAGDFAQVEVTRAGPHYLEGSLVGRSPRPSVSRRRIPLAVG
ncbi:MAG: TRAM domain-containing protein, partial [Actinobacteria bacterium]|nr:TRAM domain-containing protein [Actinomycetota bacterium]